MSFIRVFMIPKKSKKILTFYTWNMMKKEEKYHYLQKKNKIVIGLMKDEREGEMITKFATTAVKPYGYKV